MKRLVIVGCSILALVLLFSISAAAGPVVPAGLETAPLAPFAGTDPAAMSPADTGSIIDVIKYSVCCGGNLASCAASCGGNVGEFKCYPLPNGGCTSRCTCL